ncbi:exported hypothetical protein [Mesorhizobium sp. ORS 3324]|nr:exported hypothetical protein [Mesorhizobium sp. ORS 3324]
MACGAALALRTASGSAVLNGFAAGATVAVVVLSRCGAAGARAGAEAVRIGLTGAAAGAEGGGSCCEVTGSRLERLTDWVWLPSTGAGATVSPGYG